MVACHDTCGCQDETIGIGNGQHIGCLRFLASLISNGLTAFLGRGMAAVQVEMMGIDLLSDAQNAVCERPLQATILTPLAIVMIDCMITDLLFFGSFKSLSMGIRAH